MERPAVHGLVPSILYPPVWQPQPFIAYTVDMLEVSKVGRHRTPPIAEQHSMYKSQDHVRPRYRR